MFNFSIRLFQTKVDQDKKPLKRKLSSNHFSILFLSNLEIWPIIGCNPLKNTSSSSINKDMFYQREISNLSSSRSYKFAEFHSAPSNCLFMSNKDVLFGIDS